jgi:tetratricopeptide (TPR) repeat protein
MKKYFIINLLMLWAIYTDAQPNCNAYYTAQSPCGIACAQINKALQYPQGSWQSQKSFDSLLRICPQLAYLWSEKSVPYLKRGDYAHWRLYLDKAVAIEPKVYLGYRAGCLFDNVKDYKQALADINELESLLNSKYLGSNPSGDLNLLIIKALCYRALNEIDSSLATFELALLIAENNHTVGNFDYFYWGTTLFQLQRYEEAEAKFKKQIEVNSNLAYTNYYLGCIEQVKKILPKPKIILIKLKRITWQATPLQSHTILIIPIKFI